MKPLVSVIIPTKNSEQFLDKCLASIKNQTYKNVEVIVVDNFSTDKTLDIARKFTKKVYQKGPERSAQVNYGASKSKGKYLYRVDSDFLVESNVISECVEKCENEGFDCIAVHNTSDPTVSFWAKVRKFERDMYKGDDLIVAARFWSRRAFLFINGFDEKMIACEDYNLHNKMISKGFRIGRINSVEIHLGEPRTLKEICVKSYQYGKTIQKVKADSRLKKQLSPFRKAFLRNVGEFLVHPVLSVGFVAMNLVKFIGFKLGTSR